MLEHNRWGNSYGGGVSLYMVDQHTRDVVQLVIMVLDRYMPVLWIDKYFSVIKSHGRSWFPPVEIPDYILEVESVRRVMMTW